MDSLVTENQDLLHYSPEPLAIALVFSNLSVVLVGIILISRAIFSKTDQDLINLGYASVERKARVSEESNYTTNDTSRSVNSIRIKKMSFNPPSSSSGGGNSPKSPHSPKKRDLDSVLQVDPPSDMNEGFEMTSSPKRGGDSKNGGQRSPKSSKKTKKKKKKKTEKRPSGLEI